MESGRLRLGLRASTACVALGLALCIQGANAQPYATGAESFQQGRDLIEGGRPGEAIPFLQQAVQAAPGDPDAHYALAEAYYRSGDLMSALTTLRAAQVRSIDPSFRQNVEAKAQAIETMLAEKRLSSTRLAPTDRTAEPLPLRTPVSGSAPPAANPAATISGSDFDAAGAALQSGDLDTAHILALTGLRTDPRSARGSYLLAEVLVGKKDLAGARKAYGDALSGTNLPASRKDEIEHKLLRLEIAMEPGLDGDPTPSPVTTPDRLSSPVSPARTAQDGTENNAYRSPVNAAAMQAASGNVPGAIDELRRYLAGNPSDASARVALARYLIDSGDSSSALEELGKVIAITPANDTARDMRISILMANGDYGAALADLDAIVVAGRATATTFLNRGVSNQQLGERTLALQDYDQAIAMDPSNTGVFINKASVLMEMRQDQAAIDTLSMAIARDGSSLKAVLYRGMAYFNLGRFVPAAEDFGRALALDPGNSQASMYREKALNAVNERVKAGRPPVAP
ncbi:tetratricopeptide repeat protein [Emcibacter sp. SYSU 3D8]|uniref:tetratricopeptide repeat protein n=1 Tax=Emcibacter sp. SYSU 3D8 TaxID=3133969 RepID=UPI0031FE6C16